MCKINNYSEHFRGGKLNFREGKSQDSHLLNEILDCPMPELNLIVKY